MHVRLPRVIASCQLRWFSKGIEAQGRLLEKAESTGIICRRRLVIHLSITMENIHPSLF